MHVSACMRNDPLKKVWMKIFRPFKAIWIMLDSITGDQKRIHKKVFVNSLKLATGHNICSDETDQDPELLRMENNWKEDTSEQNIDASDAKVSRNEVRTGANFCICKQRALITVHNHRCWDRHTSQICHRLVRVLTGCRHCVPSKPLSATFYCAILERNEQTEGKEMTEFTSKDYKVQQHKWQDTKDHQLQKGIRKSTRSGAYDLKAGQRGTSYHSSRLTSRK